MLTTDLSRHILSKSTFMRGYQCRKSLWLHKYKPGLSAEIEEQQMAIFQQGQNVGKLARDLFPNGEDASPPTPFEYQKSVALTGELISSGQKVIYEACFQYNQVLAALDILVFKKGRWYAYEVKSSTAIKPQYIIDSALQYYVMKMAGLELQDFSIVHIDNSYLRKGRLEIDKLFHIESIYEQIIAQQDFIESEIEELKKVVKSPKQPTQDIGGHCSDPYPCDFMGHCWKHIPEDSVFELRGRGAGEAAFELYKQGILELKKIPDDYELSNSLRFQVDSFKKNITTVVKDEIKKKLSELEYPLHFLDFETYNVAIPEFDNSWPYEQIPFQYSLHIQDKPGGQLEHIEFLAEAGTDPRKEFAESLIRSIGKKGSIIAYNKAFETRIMNDLCGIFPDLDSIFKIFISRMFDLMTPFQKRHYYKPEMKGSYSIKEVLPALVPDLTYENMEVANGGDASTAFYNLRFKTDKVKIEQARKSLLRYCGLDTLAMVKILEVLIL